MALIPPFFLDCVVAIGIGDDAETREWKASGFLYAFLTEFAESGDRKYRIYLVSNRHVFEEISEPHIYLRFNPQEQGGPVHDYRLPLFDENNERVWIGHPDPNIDVAITNINYPLLKDHALKVDFFRNDVHSADISKLEELEISEGDFLYVLGFPMGLVSNKRAAVIVRNGTVARIRDTLAKTDPNPEYLIDSFVFPGNSGGPVVLKPETIAITGTKAQTSAYLIGIVRSTVTYRDAAISMQTHRARIIFEENSGLAAVHPVDFINETIMEHLELFGDDKERPNIYLDRS